MLTEKMIHEELEGLIKSGSLYTSINEKDILRIKNLSDVDENLLPAFSIDEYIRRKYTLATNNALKSIEDLQVLTSNKNVSTQFKQTLRPDLVCINPESQQIVIFEIKKSTQTERQALTELLAYEHEVKNLLPFLSTYDLTFVLVSTEWSVLLEHAAGSAIAWNNKNLLCLKVNPDSSEFKYDIHKPDSWSITGSAFFPPESVASLTLSFEADKTIEESEIVYRLDLMMGFFAREADRIGLHGFGIVTTDLGPYVERGYQIVFCAVSPLAFFDNMLASGQISSEDGHLVKQIEAYKDVHGIESGISSLESLIKRVIEPRLAKFSNIEFGGYFPWTVTRSQIKARGLPTFVEFWGLPGDYARDYINNPAVQRARPSLFEPGMTDWRYPTTAIWLIRNLFQPAFCSEGVIRPSDSFRLGLTIGHDSYLRHVAKASLKRPKSLEAATFWNYTTLEHYVDELFILGKTAKTIDAPKKHISLSPEVDYEISHDNLIEWITTEILQSHDFHIKMFYLGLNLSQAITAEDLRTSDFIKLPIDDEILNNLRSTIGFILKHSLKTPSFNETEKLRNLELALGKLGRDKADLESGKIDFTGFDIHKLSSVVKETFTTADLTIESVTHLFDELPPMHVDWETLKEGIDGMYRRGIRYPAICIETNGSIGTASYDDVEYAKPFQPLTDTEAEVLVMDASRGFVCFRKMKWDDVRAGKLIKKPTA